MGNQIFASRRAMDMLSKLRIKVYFLRRSDKARWHGIFILHAYVPQVWRTSLEAQTLKLTDILRDINDEEDTNTTRVVASIAK